MDRPGHAARLAGHPEDADVWQVNLAFPRCSTCTAQEAGAEVGRDLQSGRASLW